MSLNDDLDATMDAILAGEHEEEVSEPEQSTEVNETAEQEEAEQPEKETEEKAEEKTEEKAEKETAEKETKTEDKPEETDDIKEPPKTWRAQSKVLYSDLPDEIKSEIHKREADFHKGIEQYKENANFGGKIQRVLQPYEALIRSSNQQPENIVAEMLNASYKLETGTPEQKAQFLMQIARNTGADLSIFSEKGQNNEQGEAKPAYVQQLEQQVAQLQGYLQSQQTTAKQQEYQSHVQNVEQFKNETTETGEPAYPFFDDVREDMANLIDIEAKQGRNLSLKDAYDRAVWARPDTREAMQMLTTKQQQAKQEKERREQAAKAKARTGINVRSTAPNSELTQATGSIDDTMDEILKNLKI